MQKNRMIIGAVALVAIGMIFAGVGYALTYTGTVSNSGNTGNGEYITVDLGNDAANYSQFIKGVYTLNSSTAWVDSAAKVTFSGLQKDGAGVDTVDNKFAWSNDKLVLANPAAASGYTSGEAGSLGVNIHQTTGATATNVTMKVEDLPAIAYKQYGMNLVYTYQIGAGDETVITSAELAAGFAVTLTSGQATVTLKAYVVYYDDPIALASVDYVPFVFNNVTMNITVTAATA